MSHSQNNPCYFYSPAVRSTAVEHCVSGHFTSNQELNLILAKNSRLEIYLVGPEGLSLMKEVRIFGKIEVMFIFRPLHVLKDYIFLLTNKFDFMILDGTEVSGVLEIITRIDGNVSDRVGRFSENGSLAAIDPSGRVIGLRLYDGVLKILQLDNDISELKVINIQMEETFINDLKFLYGYEKPTIVFIYEAIHGCHVKTYEICLEKKAFVKIPWKQDNIDKSALIIPITEPLGGAVIIGGECILYNNGSSCIIGRSPIIQHNSISCFARVDSMGRRFVLGDTEGRLFLLFIEIKDKTEFESTVTDIKIEYLGEIAIPECISYLDNGVFFIGSRMGDSQIVKLNENLNVVSDSYLTIMDTFTNLAPILDMAVVDLGRQGQSQLITCSGSLKEGSLRIIRNGIGIHELAIIDLASIINMWTMCYNSLSVYDNLLVLSFVGHTLVLSLINEEVEETEIFGFQSDQQTLHCSKVDPNFILQITSQFVRLFCVEMKQILSEWVIDCDHRINNVSVSQNQIVCTSGRNIFYLEIYGGQIVEQTRKILEHEISSVDATPFHGETHSNYVALGLWTDISIRILKLPLLNEVHREYLGGEIISRSILFASFDEINYLFCALGDGSLFYFKFNDITGQLMEKKRITLGTQPSLLRSFKWMGRSIIFVCSDRPTIIYSFKRKLFFSNVNLKEVNIVCPLNSNTYPDSLMYSNGNSLSIGVIDVIQKLHICTVPLHEAPRRIVCQESSQTLGIITTRLDVQGPSGLEIQRECASSRAPIISDSQQSKIWSTLNLFTTSTLGAEIEINHFLLLDQHSFEVLHAHQMYPREYALSLISCQFTNDPNVYYVIGTALLLLHENEPKRGRIIIFHVQEGKLKLVYEKEVSGACFSLVEFNGKLLASVNSTVELFEWTSEMNLKPECSYSKSINALFLKTKGDFVLVGDLMKSITLLQHMSLEKKFEEIAHDYYPKWMTAVEILDDDTYLGAENASNLFICQKDSSSTNDEERQVMIELAQFHLGDMINVFKHGSLIMQPIGVAASLTFGSVMFGTVSGAIGAVSNIPTDLYELLNEIQLRLSMTIKSIGRIRHDLWRSYHSELKNTKAEGFIDGDLIESFLELSKPDMENLICGLHCPIALCQVDGRVTTLAYDTTRCGPNEEIPKQQITVDAVLRIVEELTRFY